LSFALRNSGNCDAEFVLEVTSNLGEFLFEQTGKLAAAARHPITAKIEGKYRETPAREPDPSGTLRAITVRLRHSDMDASVLRETASKTRKARSLMAAQQ